MMSFESIEKMIPHFWDPENWVGAVVYAIGFFIGAMILSRLVKLTAHRVLLRKNRELVDPTVVLFLTQFAQIGVYVVGLVIFFHIVPALNKLGTALLTGVSVVSVVFGLAAQNTLANLVAGCTLLLYRPFHIDDLIQVATPTGTESGIVERLTLGYTMLRTMDDRLVVVPNSLMASQVSLNLNRRSLHAMVIVLIGVTSTRYLTEVRGALTEITQANKKILRVISYHTQMLDEGSAIVSLRAWCASKQTAKDVQNEITEAVQQRFAGKDYVFVTPTEPPKPLEVAKAA